MVARPPRGVATAPPPSAPEPKPPPVTSWSHRHTWIVPVEEVAHSSGPRREERERELDGGFGRAATPEAASEAAPSLPSDAPPAWASSSPSVWAAKERENMVAGTEPRRNVCRHSPLGTRWTRMTVPLSEAVAIRSPRELSVTQQMFEW